MVVSTQSKNSNVSMSNKINIFVMPELGYIFGLNI